jgi:hypothetical protein
MPVSNLRELLLLMAIEEEYPLLEYVIVGPVAKGDPALVLPGTLEAPHLHHSCEALLFRHDLEYLRLLWASSHSILT